jgi:hypothetical protein
MSHARAAGAPVPARPDPAIDVREVLARLVGDWTVTGELERPGRSAVPVVGRVHARWILEGTAVALDQYDDARHVSRVHYAYDRSRRDFVAFSLAVTATHFEHERGVFDGKRNALVLLGEELLTKDGLPLTYARTVTFRADGFDTSITYPHAPPGRYGEVHLQCRPLT